MAIQNSQYVDIVRTSHSIKQSHRFLVIDRGRVRLLIACALATSIFLLVAGGLVQSHRWTLGDSRQVGHRTVLSALANTKPFSWFIGKAPRISNPAASPAWGYPAIEESSTGPLGFRQGATQPLLSYADLPLSFESGGEGSISQDRFVAVGRGYRLSLLPQEAVLDLISPSKNSGKNIPSKHQGRRSRPPALRSETVLAKDNPSLHLKVVNGSPSAQISGLEELRGRTFYFEGKDSGRWRTDVRNYARVQYRGIYPGVDLVYYGNQHQLEYDFIVAPGADPDQIRLSVSGARRVELDAQGNLVVSTSEGEVLLRKPLVYQRVANTRREIAGNFRVEGQEVGFAIGAYDRSRELVIDPTLNYATYLGRSVNDKVNAIALGVDGSTYVAGIAPAITSRGQNEAFVAHISTDGKELLYMAYLGGSGATDARGIAVDASGNVYVTGETKAPDFPAQNALQSSCSLNASRQCAGDAFLAKLNPDGSLNFATYLGGSGEDAGNAIALDAAGNIYITGSTASTDFPVFHPAQATTGGNGDAFVAKISSDGQHVLYATYLGGTGSDEALGIAVDASSSVYVTGQTLSPDFPTENAFQPHCLLGATNRCMGEAFVTKLSSDGSSLVYSTYFGGSGGDSANAIAVDSLGQVYVAGQTLSVDFPLASPLQAAAGGKTEAFISKFLPNGSGLVYSTFLGGSGDDVATSIAVDSHGNAFVSGYTDSVNFPMQSPVQSACHKDSTGACSQDAFLAVLNSSGSALKFSTYLGGTGADEGKGIALDTKGSAYLGGASTSSDFPSAQPIVVPSGVSPVLLQSSSQVASTTSTSAPATLPSNLSGGGVVAMISGLPNADATLVCSGSNNWTGGAGDNQWTSAANWSSAAVPISTDSVCIGTGFASATITVGNLATNNQTIASLVSNANITVTIGPLTVTGATTGAMFANALSITGGTLTLSGTNGSSVGGTMTQSGGILAGTDTLTVAGLLTWTGGYECTTVTSGSCTTPTGTQGITNASGGMSLSSDETLNGRTLNTSGGTVTVTGSGYLGMASGATVNNTVAWNVGASYIFYSGASLGLPGTGTFNNNSGGTFTKSDASTSNIYVLFDNTGTVNVCTLASGVCTTSGTGTLIFQGGDSCTTACNGAWTVASGGTLEFNGGTFNPSGSFTGTGTVTFASGTLNLTGNYGVTGTTNISGATVNFNETTAVSIPGAMNLSSGILNGPATVNIGSLLTWTGGSMCTTQASGSCTTPTGTQGITNASGGMSLSSDETLNGRTLNTSGGTVTVTGSGYLGMASGATVNNTVAWNVGGSYTFYSGASVGLPGTGTFNNNTGGTFTKSDASTTTVYVPFNNMGTVNVCTLSSGVCTASGTGTLILQGGDSCTTSCNGAWMAASGGTLEFNGGTFNPSGGFTGTGTVTFASGTQNLTGSYGVSGTTNISGGTVNFNETTAVTIPGAVNLSGGIMDGPATVSIGGLVTWTGGSMCTTQASGSCTTPTGTQGITNASGGMSLSGGDILAGRTLNTTGGTVTVTSSGGYLALAFGSTVNNTAAWNVGGSYIFYTGPSIGLTGTGTFNNNTGGTFTKSDASTSIVYVPFNNMGTVNVCTLSSGVCTTSGTGTLNLQLVGNSTGNWSAAGGGLLELSSGLGNTSTLNGGFSGTGTVDFGVNQGTINVTGSYGVTGGTQSTGSGTTNFVAPGTVSSVGALAISSGIVNFSTGSSPNANTITAPTMNLSGGILTGIDQETISGLTTWTGGNICTTQSAGSCTAPTGTQGITNPSGGMSLSGGDILVGRTLNTTGGTVTITSSGGYLALAGGATVNSTTTWNIGGSYQLYSGAQVGVTGTGTFNNNTGGTFTKSDASTSIVYVPFNNMGKVNVCTLSSGVCTTSGTGTLNLQLVGNSTGNWSAAGGGLLELSSGLGNTSTLNGGFSGTGTVDFGVNQGTINVTGSYGVTGGTQSTGSGTTNFVAPGTVSSVGALAISSGIVNFSTGSSPNANTITAPTMNLSGGILTGIDQETISGLTTWTGGNICTTQSAGSCTAPTGTQGITNPSGGMSLSGGDILVGRTLNTTGGTVTITSSGGYLALAGGATVNSTTTWNIGGSYQLYSGAQVGVTGTGTFNNNTGGTFTKSDASTSIVYVPFNNMGKVNVCTLSSGVCTTSGTGTLNLQLVGNSTGNWSAAGGGLLELSSGLGNTSTLNGGFSGAGTVDFGVNQGTINVTGSYGVTGGTQSTGSGTTNFVAPGTVSSVGALAISSGIVNFSTGSSPNANTITAPTMNLSGGILTGIDQETISGLTTWTGGNICTTQSAGSCTAPTGTQGITNPSGGMSLSGGDILVGRTLNTTGGTVTITSSGGYLALAGGATVNSTTTWNIGGSYQLYSGAQVGVTGTGTFNNNTGGTFTKSDASTSIVYVPFNNMANVFANAGTLSFSGAYTQTAGNTFLGGGSIQTSNPLSIQGGTVTGSGTITNSGSTAVISNTGGTLSPGVSTTIGSIAIGTGTAGNYSQGSSGALNAKIAGTGAGQYDTLSASGTATLAGTLNVTLDGYTPVLGDSFTILTAGSVGGTFAITNFPTLSAGLGFKVTYNATSVVLSVVTVASPVATLSATSLSFPNTIVGSSSPVNRTVMLQNTGTAPLTIASILPTGTDAANYSYAPDATSPCPATLGNGSSCILDIDFTPLTAATHNNAQITITDNNGNVTGSTQTISLSGTGIQLSSIAVTPNPATTQMGNKIQFTATGTYTDNSTQNLSSAVNWNSTSMTVATISTAGLASALSGGTSNITASQTISGGTVITSPIDVFTVTAATHFSVSAQATATEGTAFNFTVTALDQNNITVPGYAGIVHFTSTDPLGVLPANTTLTNGSGTFAATLKTAGSQTITATDTVTTTITGTSNVITVGSGTPASITATAGTPQSAVINTAFGAALQATVKDNGGNLLSGVSVVFTAPSTGASGTFANGTATYTATTNGSGIAVATTFTADGIAGGPYTVTATVAGVTAPANYSLTNTTGTAASVTATAGTPQSAVINTAFGTLLAATVKDSGGNLLSGVSVVFTAPGTGASGTFANGTATTTATTNSSGVATATAFTADGIAGGPYTVTATVAGVTTPANYSLTNTTGTAASVTATAGTPQSAVINTAFGTLLAATVKDSGGNLLSGVSVVFTAPGTGASGTFANGTATTTATTNSSGVATATAFTADGIAGGPYTVTATVAGVTTPANYSLTNTTGTAASVTATAGTPQSAVINTAFGTLLAATVKDSGGNLLSGVSVVFTAPGTGASGTFANGTATTTATTNSSGVATATAFTADGIAGGPYTVTATVAGVTTPANYSLTNTTGTPASVTATAGTSQSATINTAFGTLLAATVKDSGGNLLSGVSVVFTAPGTGASGTFANGTATTTATTNSSGVATATAFTADGIAGGPYTVTATVAGVTTPANYSLTNTTGTPASVTATAGTSQSAVINTAFGTLLAATVKDSGGNLLSGVSVVFTAPGTGASGTFANGTATTTATTNSSGVATATAFTADGIAGGPYTVTATVVGVTTPANYSLTNTTGTAASVTATAGTPQSAVINTAFGTLLAATVKDSGGNLLSGVSVVFTAPGTGASGTFANGTATTAATTNSSGVATATAFTADGIAGGPYTVTATVAGVTTPANYSLTNTTGTAASVTATAGTPQSAVINTAFGTLLAATVKDSGGNLLSGVSVVFTAPGTGASGTFANGTATTTATTNSSGVATATAFTADGIAGGPYTVTATVAGVTTPANYSLTNTTGTPASVTATAGTPQSAVINTAFGTLLAATVKDSGGNLLSGVPVVFTAPGTGASGTFANGTATTTATTNSSGVATATAFTADGIAGGPYTVTATVAGVTTPANYSLTNTTGTPASVTATAGTPQSAVINTAFGTLLAATVKDSGGNLLSGVPVVFTAPGTGASGTFANGTATTTATTNSSGVATATAFTADGIAGGPYTVTATVAGVTTPANYSLTNTTGTAASVTATAGTPQSAVINTAFGTLLAATVKDSGGNLLSGVSVVFTAPGTGASGTFANGTATTTATTNSSGVATATAFTADGIAGGPYTVTATVAGVTTPANYSLTNTTGTAASVTATAGTPQSAVINTAFGTLLAATVKDSGGNLLSGVSVVFTAPSTGASGTFANGTATTTATTNSSGVATATAFTADGIAGGPYTVTATVAGVTTPANYSLTNTTGTAASVTATAGTPQSAVINTAFGTLLAATVKDSGGNLLSGVPVVFTAPGTGASGTFANGTATTTATTNSSGVATATAFTADGIAGGPYTVTATVAGVTTPANYSLTNTTGTPASVTATAGTPQSAVINTAFGTLLAATVKDSGGNLLSGVSVVFTAPGTGASGTFANGTATTAATTNSSGVATATAFTADGIAGGPYTVTATVAGVTTPANYSLTNTTGTPASVTATAGTPQSAVINTAFGTLLAATVKDSGGNLLSGVSVVFTAPGTGASGTFANGTATTTATTNSSGVARASTFTANGTAGPYTVTAMVAGVPTPATYSLANTTVTVGAGIAFVQGRAGNSLNVSSKSLAFPAANTAGNLIVVGVDWHDTQNFGSISDSAGNTYIEVGTELRVPGRFRLRLYYAKNIVGGPNTVTVTLGGTIDVVEVYIHEYSGADPVAPLDTQSGMTGTSSSATSGTANATSAQDLVFGYCVTGTATAGPGFTVRSSLDENLTEDKIAPLAGPVSATATASSAWALQMGAFKPAFVVPKITFVQGTAANSLSTNSKSLAFPAANTPGNLIVVGVDWEDTQNFGSISDSAGNTYIEVGTELRVPGQFRLRLYYANNIAGGPNTVTVTLGGSVPVLEVYIQEYNGADPVAPLDAQSGMTGTGSSATSGTATATSPHDLIFGYCVTGIASAGAGFTVRSNFDENLTEDKIAPSAGPVSATATASSAWALQMGAFRP